MKMIFCLSILAVFRSLHAQGFLHLTNGQSYTYSFSTVPFLGIGADANYGLATFYFNSGPSDPQTQILFEMFETSVSDAPVRSLTLSQFGDSVLLSRPGAWQDLQGSMRVSVLNGAVDLSGLQVQVLGGPFDPFGYHSLVVSVPEPSNLLLLGLGLIGFFLLGKKRNRWLPNHGLSLGR